MDEKIILNVDLKGGQDALNIIETLKKEVNELIEANKKMTASEKAVSTVFEENKAKIIAKNREINNQVKALANVRAETIKMKSAFDVVNAGLQVASNNADSFIVKMLSIRFPNIGEMSQKEMKILYQTFTQAERLGSGMFDMASLAAKVFKGDMNQVNLAIAQYNELFEKNAGVEGITLNTSALLALRNQVIATGSSVSILNKEINNMVNEAESIKTFEGLMANINNFIEKGRLNVDAFADALIAAKNNTIQLNEDLIIGSEQYYENLEDITNELEYLRSFRTNPDEFFSTTGSGSDELERQIKKQQDLLKLNRERSEATADYSTSIQGLYAEVQRLTTQYEQLGAAQRDGVAGKDIITQLGNTRKEISKAETELNRLNTAANRTRRGGFDPLANSILQVGREFPNFFISAHIGFMAISNNLPILGEAYDDFKRMQQAARDAGEEVPKMGNSIKKAFGGISGMLTVAAGLFLAFGDIAIKAITEWINKIPKDLEIKLELGVESLKSTQKVRESIKEIQHEHNMANKARLEGDNKTSAKIIDNLKKQLDTIKDGAAKEYELAKDKDKWLTEFAKAENERQRKLAYNKALFAKQAEAEITIAQEKQNQKLILQAVKTQMEIAAKRPGIQIDSDKLTEDFAKGKMSGFDALMYGLSGEVKIWNESIEKLKEAREQNAVLLGLKPYDIVDFDKTKPSGGTSIAGSSYSPEKLKDDPEYLKAEIIARNEIKWEEWKAKEKSNLQKEEEAQLEGSITKRLDIFQELRNEINRNEAALKDIEEEQYNAMVTAGNAEQKYRDFNEALKVQEDLYNQLQQSVNRKASFDNEMIVLNDRLKKATEDYSKSKNKNEAAANKAVVDAIKEEIAAKQKQIETNNALIKSNEVEIKKIEEKLVTLKEGTKEYEDAMTTLNALDLERLRILNATANAERQIWLEKIAMVREYMDSIGSLAAGFADISQGNMDLINAEYDRQVWVENEKIQSAKAREDALFELDVKRWEALQKDFENQKKWKEAQAWMDFASGSVGIWSGVNSKLGVPGVILAGIQQAALLATTIGNIKSIKAQQMLKPQRGGGSSGAVGGSVPALNPHKEALTSRDENLNKMSRANLDSLPEVVVRVSDINEIQKKVDVRDKNSTM